MVPDPGREVGKLGFELVYMVHALVLRRDAPVLLALCSGALGMTVQKSDA